MGCLLAAVERLQVVGEAHPKVPPRRPAARASPRRASRIGRGGSRPSGCDIPVCLPDRSRKHEAWVPAGLPPRRASRGSTRLSRSRRWRAPGARCCCAPIAIDCAGRTSRTATARRRSSWSSYARRGAVFSSTRHLANVIEQRFVSRVGDRRRALSGRSPMQAAFEAAVPLGGLRRGSDRSRGYPHRARAGGDRAPRVAPPAVARPGADAGSATGARLPAAERWSASSSAGATAGQRRSTARSRSERERACG